MRTRAERIDWNCCYRLLQDIQQHAAELQCCYRLLQDIQQHAAELQC
jgi:hypothetical protein